MVVNTYEQYYKKIGGRVRVKLTGLEMLVSGGGLKDDPRQMTEVQTANMLANQEQDNADVKKLDGRQREASDVFTLNVAELEKRHGVKIPI